MSCGLIFTSWCVCADHRSRCTSAVERHRWIGIPQGYHQGNSRMANAAPVRT